METSLAESQTDSYFPTKWPNGYPKQKDVSDTHIQRQTITKINHDRRTALERFLSRVGKGIICSKIERKAMIRNRYNYPTPPIRDTKPRSSIMPSNICHSDWLSMVSDLLSLAGQTIALKLNSPIHGLMEVFTLTLRLNVIKLSIP